MIRFLKNNESIRLFGTAGIVLLVRISGTLLTLFYTLLMLTVAVPDQVGLAFGALSAGFLLSVLASLNVESGSIRYLPLYFENERLSDAAGYVLWCRRTVIVVTIAVLMPVLGIMIWHNGLEVMGPYILSFVVAPIVANARINSRHGVALGLVLQASIPRILVSPLFMTSVFVGANMLDLKLDAMQIMGAFLIGAMLSVGSQWLLIRHAMTFRHEAIPTYVDKKEWVIFGLMLSPMLIMNEYLRDLVILMSDVVLIPADIARLAISLSMISVLNFGLNAVDMVFSPLISRATAQKNSYKRARLLSICGVGKLIALALGVPLIWLLVPYVLDLMGSDYSGIEEMFLVLAIIPASRAIFGPANMMLNVTGQRNILFVCATMGAAAIMLGILAGSALDGREGVTVGAALGLVFYQALLFIMCRLRTGIDTTALSIFWERRKTIQKASGPEG